MLHILKKCLFEKENVIREAFKKVWLLSNLFTTHMKCLNLFYLDLPNEDRNLFRNKQYYLVKSKTNLKNLFFTFSLQQDLGHMVFLCLMCVCFHLWGVDVGLVEACHKHRIYWNIKWRISIAMNKLTWGGRIRRVFVLKLEWNHFWWEVGIGKCQWGGGGEHRVDRLTEIFIDVSSIKSRWVGVVGNFCRRRK